MAKRHTTSVTQITPTIGPLPEDAILVQIYGEGMGKRFPLSGVISIGRDETNTVAVDMRSVSRRHAQVYERRNHWYVRDLGSTNGTFVNGSECEREVMLANGDLLKCGGAIFKFIEGGNVESLYHEEIYRLTILDGLTGIHNKRYFMEFLSRELARSARHQRPLILVMMDIDHFKKLNDQHGHLTGDFVLQKLGQLLRHSTRREDLFARYGGEEFAFVLPEITLVQAKAFCERIRRKVAEYAFRFEGKEIPVTVSLGAAAAEKDSTVETFIQAADRQLYRAKGSGRNTVCIHEP